MARLNMRVMYRCRLCGKEYSDTNCPASTAHFIAENLCVSEEVTIHGARVKRYDTHICRQGNTSVLGFADFIGIESDQRIEKAGDYADQPTLIPGT